MAITESPIAGRDWNAPGPYPDPAIEVLDVDGQIRQFRHRGYLAENVRRLSQCVQSGCNPASSAAARLATKVNRRAAV